MKLKKLEKRIQFIFKRKNITNLDKDQMKRINGGNATNSGDFSGNPQCDQVKTAQQTVSD